MGIGNIIKRLRLIKGYNQKYMASQLGISERQYNNIENQITVKVTEARKKRIAEILEIDHELLKEDGTVVLSFQTNEITKNENGPLMKPTDLKAIDLLIKRIEFMEAQSQEDRATIKDLMNQIKENQSLIEKLLNKTGS